MNMILSALLLASMSNVASGAMPAAANVATAAPPAAPTFAPHSAYAASVEADSARAREIFEEMQRRQDLALGELATQEMVITDKRGRTRTRVMKTWTRRDPSADVRDQLIVFMDPGSVRGSAFLTLSIGGVDQQRLYLPAVGRIQTIQSEQSGEAFMGSDFTYDDLGSQDADDYVFSGLQETDAVWLISAQLREPSTDKRHTRLEFHISKSTYALAKVLYLDDNGSAVRELIAEGFENLTGDLWSPSVMTMKDLEQSTSTTIRWTERQLNSPIEAWRFSDRGLMRGL
jgi:hypothetical protein